MSATGRPSGIKPPSTRLVKPSVNIRPTSSNGSSGENIAGLKSSDDQTKKKATDRYDEDLDDGTGDVVSDLPSLPGSRKASEQRKLSDGTGSALDAAYELARRLSEAGIRRSSDAGIVLTADTDSFIIGQRVYVNGVKPGVIQFIGETKFAPGEWAGIVLDDMSGKNDGSVAGVRYFQCAAKKGVFSRLTRLTRQPLDATQLAVLKAQQPNAGSENGDSDSFSRQTSPPPVGADATSPRSELSAGPMRTVISVPAIGDLRLGDRVIVTSSQGSKTGILRFLGNAEFASGQWAGVELDEPLGKNDGAVAGTRYFECQPMYGLFAPIHKVTRSPANQMRRPSGAMNTSISGGSTRGGPGRQGARDSVTDRTSVASVTSSRTSAAASRKGSRPSIGGSAHGTLQGRVDEDGTADGDGCY